ncbi:SGNH/GDSL hydrolase family protein [Prauserella cavernicola]|uniref:SGNH/GDSL hydrolase family protein n=1 Tax=Prauserella cavernicola TaxID=2800127 RepID=UPI0027DACDAF|nr:SGNH/GDSL hydrolase family protein [Prauserella cavernicola]
MRKALAIAALSAVAGACAPGADADDTSLPIPAPQRYVALGDSYVSGPGTGEPAGVPTGCLRSDNNYPRLVAAELSVATLSDVSCGGARTEHMTEPQPTPQGDNPPQFDALTPQTTLVTLGIGGNDVNFIELTATCPEEDVCLDTGAPGVPEWLASVIAEAGARVGTVLSEISQRAPHAEVVLVGYPTILPEDGAECAGLLPHSADEIDSLRHALDALNTMLSQQAKAHDVTYVDTVAATEGHGVCAPEDERWIEGLESVTGAHPLHPTARGERALADAVLDALS